MSGKKLIDRSEAPILALSLALAAIAVIGVAAKLVSPSSQKARTDAHTIQTPSPVPPLLPFKP